MGQRRVKEPVRRPNGAQVDVERDVPPRIGLGDHVRNGVRFAGSASSVNDLVIDSVQEVSDAGVDEGLAQCIHVPLLGTGRDLGQCAI